MEKPKLLKVRISDLVPHEETKPERIEEIKKLLREEGLKRPIVVYNLEGHEKYLILDGHHRAEALKEMGYDYIMVSKIDYLSPNIIVKSWDNDKVWDKQEIITLAISGKRMKPKSTRHLYLENGKEFKLAEVWIMPAICFPLERLKEHKKPQKALNRFRA